MIGVSTKFRSEEREIMDDLDFKGQELESTLDDLDRVNRLLGGYKVTLQGIEKILGSACFSQPVEITDVGCGNGSMLRQVAKMGRSKGIKMKLKGVDISDHTIEIARKQSKDFPEISFERMDVTSEEFKNTKTDILLCTLTLHHFCDEEIENLLKILERSSQMGIVINDLHRSKTAYYLFKLYCAVFMRNEVAKKDGLTSILRGFKRKDLEWYGRNLKMRKQLLSWKWAFRFQWILLK